MTMAESERRRKRKFTDPELSVLSAEMQRHSSRLQARNLTVGERSRIWESIAHCVSAVGVCKRSAPECKRRWHDLKRKTKERISSNHSQESASEETVEQPVGLQEIHTGHLVLHQLKDDLMPGPSGLNILVTHLDGTTTSHLTPLASVPVQNPSEVPSPSIPANSEQIDHHLYAEQHNQTIKQEQCAATPKGIKSEPQDASCELEAIASTSHQLVNALIGLNQNITGLRAQMQESHVEMMAAMIRIAAALEARNASGAGGESQPEWPATPRQLRQRKDKKNYDL